MLMSSFPFSFNQPNGEPQTPTRTPSFGDSFQTAKLESSFYDPRVTWDTSDPYASSPEFLRTPQRFGLNTPSNPLRLPDERRDGAEVPNVKSSTRVPEDTDTAKRIRASKQTGSFGEDAPRTVDSAKSAATMQTPPPSSASRRKVTGLDDSNDGARDGNAPGSHLETPSRLMGSSPRMLATLQSSPDLFQLGTIDAPTSPFLPQQKLFWDDHLDQPGSDVVLSGTPNADLFGGNGPDAFNHAATTSATPNPPLIPQLPTIESTVDLPEFNSGFGLTNTAAPPDTAFFPVPFSTSPRLPPTRAEDPAMFLSSPARRFGGPQPTPEKKRLSRPARQPYHHQAEESKRERLRRAQGIHRHPAFEEEEDDDDDDLTPRRARPGLTRSFTHSAISSASNRPSLGQPAGVMASTSGIRKSPSKGRLSPMKPLRNPLPRANFVATGLPTRSQSVVLKIGKDGRAKAEMETVPEAPTGLTDPLTGMDLEGSTTESEFDTAEHSEYPTISNRHASFAFSDGGRPMLARSDSGSRPQSKGSYTSTVASGPSGRASPWAGSSRGGMQRSQYPSYRPPSSHDWRRTPTKRQPPVMNSDYTYGSASSASDAFADPEEDSGDAQHALRKVLRERSRNRPHTTGFGPRPIRSSRSMAQLRSSPPRFAADLDLNSRNLNSSPTTMTDPDIATPVTHRFSNPSNGTRCVCNSMDNGGHLMIQWYVFSFPSLMNVFLTGTVNHATIGSIRNVSVLSGLICRLSTFACFVLKHHHVETESEVH